MIGDEARKILEETANAPETPFGEKLKAAVKLGCDYWEDRTQPPNMPREAFDKLIDGLQDDDKPFKTAPRKSDSGPHGHDGCDEVFFLSIKRRSFGRIQEYLIKGYFYTKERCIGVCIQTCRVENGNLYQLHR